MTNVPANVILLWPSTNGSIPTGFTRVTALDSKVIKGANGDTAGATGGASTHTHTSPAHSHDIEVHMHDYTVPDIVEIHHESRSNGRGRATEQHHTHSGTTSRNVDPVAGTNSPGTSGVATPTYGAASNLPPYFEIIFIKSDGTHTVPDGAIILSADTVIPTDYSIYAALAEKFVKGATAAGNAGGTGGSTTNVHDLTHGHSSGTHGHGPTSSSGANPYTANHDNGGTFQMVPQHTHTFTPTDTVVALNNFSGNITPSEVVQPAYKKLLPLLKATGGDLNPGAICLWIGAIADIPAGWSLCDGSGVAIDMRDKYLKCATDATGINQVGGSNTHTHAATPHSHTASAHHHTIPSLAHSGNLDDNYGSGNNTDLLNDVVHAAGNTDDVTANYQAANTTGDVANNEPPYATVHFIMFSKTYTQIQKNFAYKIRLTHQIQKNFAYSIHKTFVITVPFAYAIKRVIWTKQPRPDQPRQ